jgi:hypothetical protein
MADFKEDPADLLTSLLKHDAFYKTRRPSKGGQSHLFPAGKNSAVAPQVNGGASLFNGDRWDQLPKNWLRICKTSSSLDAAELKLEIEARMASQAGRVQQTVAVQLNHKKQGEVTVTLSGGGAAKKSQTFPIFACAHIDGVAHADICLALDPDGDLFVDSTGMAINRKQIRAKGLPDPAEADIKLRHSLVCPVAEATVQVQPNGDPVIRGTVDAIARQQWVLCSYMVDISQPSKAFVMAAGAGPQPFPTLPDDEGKLMVRAIHSLAAESGDMEFAEHGARLLESVRCIDPLLLSQLTFDKLLSKTNTDQCDLDYIWRALHVFLEESGDVEDRELGARLLAWPGWERKLTEVLQFHVEYIRPNYVDPDMLAEEAVLLPANSGARSAILATCHAQGHSQPKFDGEALFMVGASLDVYLIDDAPRALAADAASIDPFTSGLFRFTLTTTPDRSPSLDFSPARDGFPGDNVVCVSSQGSSCDVLTVLRADDVAQLATSMEALSHNTSAASSSSPASAPAQATAQATTSPAKFLVTGIVLSESTLVSVKASAVQCFGATVSGSRCNNRRYPIGPHAWCHHHIGQANFLGPNKAATQANFGAASIPAWWFPARPLSMRG